MYADRYGFEVEKTGNITKTVKASRQEVKPITVPVAAEEHEHITVDASQPADITYSPSTLQIFVPYEDPVKAKEYLAVVKRYLQDQLNVVTAQLDALELN